MVSSFPILAVPGASLEAITMFVIFFGSDFHQRSEPGGEEGTLSDEIDAILSFC